MDNETFQIIRYEGALWLGFHVALTWVAYAQWIYMFAVSFLQTSFDRLRFRRVTACSIGRDSKALSKIPKHIAIVLENEGNLEDITNLIWWTFLLGIQFVTIHHNQGFSAATREDLQASCRRKRNSFDLEYEIPIYFHAKNNIQDLSNGYHVILSSSEDGKRSICNSAKQFCSQVFKRELKSSDINAVMITEYMQDKVSEPELAISFSSFPCLHGFQPWNVRLTEILNIPTSNGISYYKYFEEIKKFANCCQRYGK